MLGASFVAVGVIKGVAEGTAAADSEQFMH
jgi:hypothetical protein